MGIELRGVVFIGAEQEEGHNTWQQRTSNPLSISKVLSNYPIDTPKRTYCETPIHTYLLIAESDDFLISFPVMIMTIANTDKNASITQPTALLHIQLERGKPGTIAVIASK